MQAILVWDYYYLNIKIKLYHSSHLNSERDKELLRLQEVHSELHAELHSRALWVM